MADYTGIPSDVKRAEFERAEIRNQLRREFQRQRQNPHITGRIEEPAVQRWAMARAQGYSYFKATPKTIILCILPVLGVHKKHQQYCGLLDLMQLYLLISILNVV
ncbi:NADH dehydrogenase [ubiquinone] 1 beta subcomplex subunit 4-like isoform X2 [Saccoglossus kowalevskii]